ncbi:MAG TPA: class I SAM-dependent methyltransferase [Burkholderiaceae bacterium]|nr:class I SAM-dependent methyltransferase [Burkholderiaceae bacterium]
MIAAWNTVLYEKFTRFRHLVVQGVARHSDAAFDRCAYPIGARVLDVGCGFGDSTIRIARRVGLAGEAVGVDCAENFVGAAEMAARDQQIENARFLIADAQTDDLHGPYDHAFASFGTMFFATPGQAMRNVRCALKPGGTFTQIVWRRREENPWLYEAELRVRDIVPVVSHDETDQVHCGPGPFSMADADSLSTTLRVAGFERISFERHDCDICIGRDIDDAIDFAMSLGPAGEIIRLAGEAGTKRKPQVAAALRDVLSRFATPDGIWAPSSTWIVTASRPE